MSVKIYVGNAFSLQMLKGNAELCIEEVPDWEVRFALYDGAKSIIGHPDTARLVGAPYNRESVTLGDGDILYVVQVQGGRLPEGCTELPPGVQFSYQKVTVKYRHLPCGQLSPAAKTCDGYGCPYGHDERQCTAAAE